MSQFQRWVRYQEGQRGRGEADVRGTNQTKLARLETQQLQQKWVAVCYVWT
jgi:hypothetical protein